MLMTSGPVGMRGGGALPTCGHTADRARCQDRPPQFAAISIAWACPVSPSTGATRSRPNGERAPAHELGERVLRSRISARNLLRTISRHRSHSPSAVSKADDCTHLAALVSARVARVARPRGGGRRISHASGKPADALGSSRHPALFGPPAEERATIPADQPAIVVLPFQNMLNRSKMTLSTASRRNRSQPLPALRWVRSRARRCVQNGRGIETSARGSASLTCSTDSSAVGHPRINAQLLQVPTRPHCGRSVRSASHILTRRLADPR
jgi:hypothetical protein